jgi:four helix bundle protein
MKSFKELKCWQQGKILRNDIKNLIVKFPDYEKYELASQMRRVSRSVTHNIAEGFGRFHHQENIQFCRIARGSLSELIDQVDVCLDEKYILNDEAERLEEQINEVMKILNGYINYLQKIKN